MHGILISRSCIFPPIFKRTRHLPYFFLKYEHIGHSKEILLKARSQKVSLI
uniref:Uncharacterized protein n=1 Tax=Arundo donax TaxID=35708 RepID=A0A0A9DHU9_ARUDO